MTTEPTDAELKAMWQIHAAEPVAVVVPCYTPSGKRVALYSAKQDLPVGTQLYTAPQPSTTAQSADSAQEDAAREPLQIFDSPRAKALMRAFEEGWAACRDAEFVGEDAQNDAFNQSATVNVCMAEDWTAAVERAVRAPADSVTAPAPPPECETEAEKRAFAFGWFKALESERMKADNKKKDPL